jgi:hypothetical protein
MEKHADYRQASLHECNLMARRQGKNARLAGEALRDAVAQAAYAAWRAWRFAHGDPRPTWAAALPTEREDFLCWTEAALAGENQPVETQREALLTQAIAEILGLYSALDANHDAEGGVETAGAAPASADTAEATDGEQNAPEGADHADGQDALPAGGKPRARKKPA